MKPIAIIGAGGHARVALAAVQAMGKRVVACTSLQPAELDMENFGWDVITDADLIERYSPSDIHLLLGIGAVSPNGIGGRLAMIVAAFQSKGYSFTGLQHPMSWVAPNAKIASTTQIHAGVIVQPDAVIGEFTIINTNASVDHDCTIGDYCHIAPGVTLSGDVRIGHGTHLGTGTSVIQGIEIGDNVMIAAGSVVVANIPSNSRVRGVPAKPF